jgi:hypothetical protein
MPAPARPQKITFAEMRDISIPTSANFKTGSSEEPVLEGLPPLFWAVL